MSKCSVARIRKSKFSYSTLFRPKYCAAADDAMLRQIATATLRTSREITRIPFKNLYRLIEGKAAREGDAILRVSNLRVEVSQGRKARRVRYCARRHKRAQQRTTVELTSGTSNRPCRARN